VSSKKGKDPLDKIPKPRLQYGSDDDEAHISSNREEMYGALY
jgi:hypothetical protein